jgi:hypothetical protein
MGLGHQGRWCRAKRVGSESGLYMDKYGLSPSLHLFKVSRIRITP